MSDINEYTVYRRQIPSWPLDPTGTQALGRHVNHDSRNLWYRHQRTAPVYVTRLHTRNIPILDQGNVGSCTGNGEVGVLGSSPNYEALTQAQQKSLNEALALKVYSGAEDIDGDGPYPPNDNGSSGPSAAKAAMKLGLISGYTHCLSLTDVIDAMQTYAVSIGINWYDSFDSPAGSDALLVISPNAAVRGGHEPMLRGVDMENKVFLGDNSWGASWGDKGSFTVSFATLTRLLAEDGDATVSVPLTQPAPVPVPPAPVPTPPTPVPGAGDDALLWARTAVWSGQRHVSGNAKAAAAVRAWAHTKGFI
jgi:hypothetical protein